MQVIHNPAWLAQLYSIKSNVMATITHANVSQTYIHTHSNTGLLTRFTDWTKGQQENRLLWLGIALGGHGCFLTPLTILFSSMAGVNLVLIMTALAAMGMSLVVNLAALPTKITIPVFFLSVLMDVAVMISALSIALGQ